MSPPDPQLTLSLQLAALHRETAEIRRLCRKQRKDLAEQFEHLQSIRRGIRYVEQSLQKSRTEMFAARLRLELSSGQDLARSVSMR